MPRDLTRDGDSRVVSAEGWSLEVGEDDRLVYRSGAVVTTARTMPMLRENGERYVLVRVSQHDVPPSERELVVERVVRGASAFYEQVELFVPSRGWIVESETRAVSLDSGASVELVGDLVVVRHDDVVAKLPVLRRDGMTLELGYTSAQVDTEDEDAAVHVASAGLHQLGYTTSLVPN